MPPNRLSLSFPPPRIHPPTDLNPRALQHPFRQRQRLNPKHRPCGNKIAFLGANSFGPQAYWATSEKAGSNGYDANKMKEDIASARAQADVVFVEYQADEVYAYTPDATNVQIFAAL